MAPRIRHLTIDSIGLFFVVIIFLLIGAKYFFPQMVIAKSQELLHQATRELVYLQTKAEVLSDSDLKTPSPTERKSQSVPVLIYHGLPKSGDDEVTRSLFKEHLFAMKRAGWNTITLEQFFHFMHGEKDIPEKSFLLTFDDGIRSSLIYGDPILEALDYTAVMFIITIFSSGEGSSYYLSRKEVEEMLASGRWEIQSHGKEAHLLIPIDENGTKGHFLSNRKWLTEEERLETMEEFRERIRKDFEESRRDVESFGVTSLAFAFPFGDFGQHSINIPGAQTEILREIKPIYPLFNNFFQFWPSQGFTYNYPIETNEDFMIRRISVEPKWSGSELVYILSIGQEKPLPHDDTFLQQEGWVSIWGDQVLEHEGMTISASEDTVGGLSFLDGTRYWTSYKFEGEVTVEKGTTISLVGRYRDGGTYISCTYSKETVAIQRMRDGVEATILRQQTPTPLFEGQTSLRPYLRIEDQTVTCGANDEPILSAILSPEDMATSGGIGLKTWDPTLDNSSAHFFWIHVEPIGEGG